MATAVQQPKARILLVEDDTSLAYVTRDGLQQLGYAVQHCADGWEALHAFQMQLPDVCILDVMIPGQDGIALAKQMRQISQRVPILFLSARVLPDDRILGLKAGADDYLTKPFRLEELALKIDVFLRRNRYEPESAAIQLGDFSFDPQGLDLTHTTPEHSRRLTAREAALLAVLANAKGAALRREEILRSVWGNDDYFSGRSLDVFISRLRKYLVADSRVKIENLHGLGFRLSYPMV